MNKYKITYFSYDEEDSTYCAEFTKIGLSNLPEEEMFAKMEEWNDYLAKNNISGCVSVSSIHYTSIDDYTVYDLIKDISEL